MPRLEPMHRPPNPSLSPARAFEGALKDGVDLRRPLLAQMGALGEAYDEWIHTPIGRARAARVAAQVQEPRMIPAARRWPGSLRMFESAFLERMSHVPWWLIPVLWIPTSWGLLCLSVLAGGLDVSTALLVAAGGLAFWTLFEYGMHRFLFHFKPRSAWGRKVHFLAHGIHHLDPWDRTRLVFPPVGGYAIAAALLGIFSLVFPLAQALAFLGGLLSGYVIYDMTHYYTHHGKPRSRWGRFLKSWHLAHHHRDWDAMYGVSSPFWDLVFGTRPPPPPREASAETP